MAESRHGNFQSCCRLCLTEKLENLKSVFAEGTDNRLLPEKISEFVAVEMNSEDKLTTMICHQCVMKVNHWHAFKQRCLRNQSKLVQWMDIAETNNVENMNIQIKEEPKDVPEIEEKPTEHLMEYSTQNDIDCPTNDIAELPESNVEVVMVKPEPLDHLEEPMEEEYNELPPPLTPYVPEVNLEVDEGSPDLPEPIQNNGFPRCTNQRKNYIKDMDDFTFFRKFRLYKGTVLHIQEQIKHELENDDVNNTLSPINQLLLTLRFYATGEYRNSFNFGDVDNSMIKSIISKVSKVIASLGPQYMKMPENQAEEKIKFHTIANFPKTIGVIDGTHIKIQNPGGDDAEVFKNRKGYYSINAQVVCSSDLKISNIVARWPGSVCDATVFMNSRIRARFENEEFGNCVILGSNGFPLQPYLLTPLKEPVTRAQELYNQSLIGTRNIAERTIRAWKSRFPCLAYGIHLEMQSILAAIVATAVLYNVAKIRNEPEPPIIDRERLNYFIDLGQISKRKYPENRRAKGQMMQDDLINNYFKNME